MKRMKDIQRSEEVKQIIIREKGDVFWEEYSKGIENSREENFIEGYKYAIRILKDGLAKVE